MGRSVKKNKKVSKGVRNQQTRYIWTLYPGITSTWKHLLLNFWVPYSHPWALDPQHRRLPPPAEGTAAAAGEAGTPTMRTATRIYLGGSLRWVSNGERRRVGRAKVAAMAGGGEPANGASGLG